MQVREGVAKRYKEKLKQVGVGQKAAFGLKYVCGCSSVPVNGSELVRYVCGFAVRV